MTGPLFGSTQLSNTFAVLGNSDRPILGETEQQLLRQIAVAAANRAGGGGSGTVTEVTNTPNDGVTINITNPTTTPDLTVVLEDITPDRVETQANGIVSRPVITSAGTWFTGGSATTTKPMWLIEPSGTTSNNWSTNGTAFGINAASGATADFISLQTDASAKFTIASTGGIYFGSATSSVARIIPAAPDIDYIPGTSGNHRFKDPSNAFSMVIFPSGMLSLGAALDVEFGRQAAGVFGVSSGIAVRLGNAAVASGALVSTHSLTIQDSTGTTYRIPVLV